MNSSLPSSAPPFPRPGSSLHYALAAVPSPLRPSLGAWASWWHETAGIPLNVSDPGVAETKLRWWQREVQESSQGQPRHPLMKALWTPDALPPPGRLPAASCWQGQLESMLTLVHQTRWLDDATLLRHARLTTGLACQGAASLLGAHSEAAQQVALELGIGLRLAHQLARLGQDARAGWVNVAIDVLQQYDVKAHQLTRPDAAHPPAGLPALLAHLHDRAAQALGLALQDHRQLPPHDMRALTPLAVLAHIHLAQMDEIVRQGDRVLRERIVLTPLKKGWIAQKVRWGWLR
ncbi:MAG: squalene/phytoene synthase family protein [Aquabacterium sp.]